MPWVPVERAGSAGVILQGAGTCKQTSTMPDVVVR
jgi:hypothetical protein